MLDVHQCHKCELRFASRTELEDHCAIDHPVDVDDDTASLFGEHGTSSPAQG